jgi:hypothetical protein
VSSAPSHRAGIAILSIEVEPDAPERVLIRVKTVHDTLGDNPPDDRPFADARAALEYLGDWLERWPDGKMDPDVPV